MLAYLGLRFRSSPAEASELTTGNAGAEREGGEMQMRRAVAHLPTSACGGARGAVAARQSGVVGDRQVVESDWTFECSRGCTICFFEPLTCRVGAN